MPDNLDKKDKIAASLLNNEYIPELYTADKLFKSKTPVQTTITDINAHGSYLNLIADKIKAKISLDKNEAMATLAKDLEKGNTLNVLITHIGKTRKAVEKAD